MSNQVNQHSEAVLPVKRKSVMPSLLLGAVGLGAAAVAFGVLPRVRQEKELKAEAQRSVAKLPRVEVVSPHYAASGTLSLPGNIQAVADTPIFARASGYVVKMYVDIGAKVQQGQLLAEIESPEVRLQLQQAQADTSKASAVVVQSQSDVAKLRAGLAQAKAEVARASAGTQQALAQRSNAQSRLAQAKAQKASAEAKVAEAEQGVEGQKAALLQSDAQLELATATAKRYHSLLEQGFVAQQEDDQAQAALKTARASNTASHSLVKAAEANLRAAKEAVNSAQAAVDTALSDVRSSEESINAARAGETAARSAVAAAASGIQSGQSVVQANRAGVNSQLANQKRYAALSSFQQLRAPFSGVITTRNIDVGTLVAAGGGLGTAGPTATVNNVGLFGLARTDELRIQVSVPQTELRNIGVGAKASVTIQELPGQTFEGTVTQVSGALDSASRTRLTEIRLKNPKGVLVPGMFAQVAFATQQSRTLRIPANTLSVDAAGTRVLVVKPDNTLHYQPVQLGRDFGTEVEVREGLHGDEKLVTNPADELHEGQRVEAVPAPVQESAAQPTKTDGKPATGK